jgi:hypothetical protein
MNDDDFAGAILQIPGSLRCDNLTQCGKLRWRFVSVGDFGTVYVKGNLG